jgi:hypothetical protein
MLEGYLIAIAENVPMAIGALSAMAKFAKIGWK